MEVGGRGVTKLPLADVHVKSANGATVNASSSSGELGCSSTEVQSGQPLSVTPDLRPYLYTASLYIHYYTDTYIYTPLYVNIYIYIYILVIYFKQTYLEA